MTDFHFLRPWWLLALLPLATLLWALRRRRGDGNWREFCDPALLPHILIEAPGLSGRRPLWLAGLAGALAVLALAGPVWERLPAPVFRNLSALVVVLDLSPAMEATDLKPNRIALARFKIEDLLRARKDGQTALVGYAGDAFTVTPLTDDAATIAAQLAVLAPGLMPVQGERADLGLGAAARLLAQAGLRAGDVLLVAGSAGEGGEAAAAKLRADGYRVSVLGVGTSEGAPIPLAGGGFLKDTEGNIRIPRLDESALRRVAEAGGGLYRTLVPGAGDIDSLLRFFDRPAEAAEQLGNAVHVEQWKERGIWLLPLLLPLAALGFRRGWLGLWLLPLLWPVPEPAAALEWRDLWLTPDQQAQREFQSGHPGEAAERFRDPAWKAAAAYKAGRYEQAARELESQDTASGQYNRGNALARQGQLEQALQAYGRALELDPGNADAEHNRELVEAALRKQQEEQKKQQRQEKNGDNGQDEGQQPQPGKDGKPESGQEPPPRQDGRQEKNRENREDAGPPPQDGRDSESGEVKDRQQPAEAAEESQHPGNRPAPSAANPGQTGANEPGSQVQPLPQGEAKSGEERKPEAVAAESEAHSENRQAEEQWLRRIPDDPGGLLKRKFYHQYRQRQQQQESERTPW